MTLEQLSAWLIFMGLTPLALVTYLFAGRGHRLARSLGWLFFVIFTMEITRLLTVLKAYHSPTAIALTANLPMATWQRAVFCANLLWVAYELRRSPVPLTRRKDDSALTATAHIIMNDMGHVMAWDPGAEVMFGWSQEEAIGRLLANMIIPLRYRQRHLAGLKAIAAGGASRLTNGPLDLEAVDRQGQEFPVSLTIRAWINPVTQLPIFSGHVTRRKPE